MYSYNEQASNDSFSFGGIRTNNGFSISTSYVGSLNGGATPTDYFLSGTPFPNGAQQLPNPYYGVVPANTSLGSSFTVPAVYLMVPLSQYGPVGNYTIPGGGTTTSHGYRPNGGSTFGQWVYNCNGAPLNCYQPIPPLGQVNLPDVISNLRWPTIANIDMSLAKSFAITEAARLQFRVDAFNSMNTPLFPGPDMNVFDGPPVHQANGNWQGYGTINLFQQNFPRIIQLSLKLIF